MQSFKDWYLSKYADWPGHPMEYQHRVVARVLDEAAAYIDEAVREMESRTQPQMFDPPPMFSPGIPGDETVRASGPKGIIYAKDGLVRRDGTELIQEFPEGWEVKILQLPHTSPFAVAAHPGHPTRIALLRNLPLPFEDWLVLGDRMEGENGGQ